MPLGKCKPACTWPILQGAVERIVVEIHPALVGEEINQGADTFAADLARKHGCRVRQRRYATATKKRGALGADYTGRFRFFQACIDRTLRVEDCECIATRTEERGPVNGNAVEKLSHGY
jgi:hypothetical protein